MAPSRAQSPSLSSEESVASEYDFDAQEELTHGTSSRKKRRLSPQTDDEEGGDEFGEDSNLDEEDDLDEDKLHSGNAVSAAPSNTVNEQISRINVTRRAEMSKVQEIDKPSRKAANTTFASLDVAPWLVSSLAGMAIRQPTGIQTGCIPQILRGRDCIGGSRTGSGKTIAFAVPILQKWAEDPIGIFAVILTPTRSVLCIVNSK